MSRGDQRRLCRGIAGRACAALALAVLLAGAAAAQEDYSVEEEHGVGVRALLDLRIARGGKAPSWMDRGPGKTRYGGVDDDGQYERVTRFAIDQLAIEPWATLPWGLRFQAQVNWEGDIDDRGDTDPDHDVPRLIEGFVRREFGDGVDGWSVLVGVYNPTFSLEHNGPAWTPKLTLTPSALNTWLWEEGRLLGFEGGWWTPLAGEGEINLFAGAGWGPDLQGILLDQRGWVLSDFLAGINSQLPLPAPGKSFNEFDERDGRPALYAGANLRDPWHIGLLRLAYYDNLGNLSVPGVWETRYGVVGFAVEPLPGLDVIFQYLYGTTAARTTPYDSTVQALYPLISYRFRGHRVSARYDDFRVDDDNPYGPSTRERGHAWTFAYLFEFWLRHRIGFEYLIVDSDRAAGPADPDDEGFQLSYRFRY